MSTGPHGCVLLADRRHRVAAKISLLDVACRLHLAVAMVDLSLAQRGGLDLDVIALGDVDESQRGTRSA